MSLVTQIVIAEILYVLAIANGIWLSHSGRPLNPGILTIHIAFGLGTIGFTSWVVWNLLLIKDPAIGILVMAIALGLIVLALIVSGMVLSFGRGDNNQILRTHNITTVLGIIVTTLTIYLLGSGQF